MAGDKPLVKRIAPGLADTGYAITGDTVRLYAKQTTDKLDTEWLDTEWLDQIRRLRRPIDAIMALTRNRNSADSAFDAESTA